HRGAEEVNAIDPAHLRVLQLLRVVKLHARRHEGVHGCSTGGPMIGVNLARPGWVEGEEGVGLPAAVIVCDLSTQLERRLKLAVVVFQRDYVGEAEQSGTLSRLFASDGSQGFWRVVEVVRAEVAQGAD